MVIGGGYGGLTCALELARHKKRDWQVTLVDPKPAFLRKTYLHKSISLGLERIEVPFHSICEKNDFEHRAEKPDITQDHLLEWNNSGKIRLEGGETHFDHLVIATGAHGLGPDDFGTHSDEDRQWVFSQDRLVRESPDKILPRYFQAGFPRGRNISIVGGGPSALQFATELDYFLKKSGKSLPIRLYQQEDRLAPGLNNAFHEYISGTLNELDIHFRLNTTVTQIKQGSLYYRKNQDEKGRRLNPEEPENKDPAGLVFLFPGIRPQPFLIRAAATGQVVLRGQPAQNLWVAGDNSFYFGSGMNTPTAQAAVRKAKLVAGNIVRQIISGPSATLKEYDYQELGFFISLGPVDGIGWMLSRRAILKGFSALLVKEFIETQYDLFMAGLDVFPLSQQVESFRRRFAST